MSGKTIIVVAVCGIIATPAGAGTQIFQNDYAGFLAASGGVHSIDFESLPDGQPSHSSVSITPAFNYDALGAHFSSPLGNPFIAGNSANGFSLRATAATFERTWVTAQLTNPATAVGVYFPGNTSLALYDASGGLIVAAEYNGSFSGNFLGIVSDVSIWSAVVDRGTNGADIESFEFHSVPEPGTLVLVFVVGLLTGRRGRGRCT